MASETEKLKKLRVIRSQCKGTITRIDNFVKDPVSLAAASADILEARKEKLITTLKDYEKVQMDILSIDQSDAEQVGDIEDKYYSVLAKINSTLKLLKTKTTSECHNASTCKLPVIEIPYYDGKDFTKFKPFFDLFTAVIDQNSSLSDVQKLFYLRKYLQEDALAVIINLPLVNESYKEAVKLLQKRFDNKARLVANHIGILLDIPTMQKGTAISIRTFVSQINQQLHALKNLEEPVEKWDMLLISILTRKLDQITNRAYQLDRDSDTMPSMASFIDYLEKRAIALEDSLPNKQSTYYDGINKNFNNKSTSYEGTYKSVPKVSNVVSKLLPPCRYCDNKDHQIYNCPLFKMLPVTQKQSYVNEKHMCNVCLNNHDGKCKFTFKCKMCKQGHNTLLHQERNVKVGQPKADVDDQQSPSSSGVSSAPAENEEPYLRINTLKTTFNVGEKKAIYCEGQHLTGDLEWYDPSGAKIPPRSSKTKRIHVEPRGARTDGPTYLPLMIQSLNLDDSGTYTCKAGDLNVNITIFVGEKVVIKESEEDRVEEEGHSIDLSCQAKGIPTPEVQWYDKDSKPIDSNEKYRILYKTKSSTSVLRINDLSHIDPGTYKCKATQEKISHFAEKFFHLSVRHKPVITNEFTEKEVYAILDEWKNITCKAIAFPAPTFTWSKHDGHYDDEMSSDGPNHKITTSKETDGNSVLTLHITNETLDTQYKCTVENPKGRQNIVFHVSPGNKPDPPTAVTMSTATTNNITFKVFCENCTFYKEDGIAPSPENLPVLGYIFQVVPHIEGYEVPYWVNGTTYAFEITSDNETTFIISDLEKSTEYHVRVATRNMAGQSDWLDFEGFPKTAGAAAALTTSIGLLVLALLISLRN